MFSSKGLFKGVNCPKLDECTLPNCIFSHPEPSNPTPIASSAKQYDPFATSPIRSPPNKRRRLDHDPALSWRHVEPTQPVLPTPTNVTTNSEAIPLARNTVVPEPLRSNVVKAQPPFKMGQAPTDQNNAAPTKLVSEQRPVSPPPMKTKATVQSAKLSSPDDKPPTPNKKENLVPRPVAKAPDLLKKRLVILQGLHQQLVTQNKRISAAGDKDHLVLDEQELVKFALDVEQESARKYESEIYRNDMTQQIFKIKRMSEGDWKSFVAEKIRKSVEAVQKPDDRATSRPSTGMDNAVEEITVLRSLKTSLAGLENYGYVTKQPTVAEIDSAKAALDASAGWENCDRCDTRFQVFPGRDDQGRLTTGGSCRYHWARSSRPASQKTDRVNGRAAPAYACCNQPMGSEGCSEAESHVFKVSDKKRLASIWQFEHTPANDRSPTTPISFDCEMGYTTLGMEVIRVTAVSWPDAKDLLDILVRPYGEVLDLNTKFSGVSKKQFMEACPYDADAAISSKEGEQKLRKVDSPSAARQLLFNLLTPDTPLLGHAIENDLNVVRIIHPTVIDTVLLYPHPRGLPIRYGLKVLAANHLNRHIQASDAAGHDSKEDAIATGDLVTKAVAEKWGKMKRDGWRFEDGLLVAPQVLKKGAGQSKAAL